MIEINIPGRGQIQIDHLVSDVNGTLALDGRLLDGVAKVLATLMNRLEIHLLTADTHAQQDKIDRQLGLVAIRIPPGGEAEAKANYVRHLGSSRVIALGQGANDSGMLREAEIGICVHSQEGLAVEALNAAEIVAPDVLSALALLDNPIRLVASLRR